MPLWNILLSMSLADAHTRSQQLPDGDPALGALYAIRDPDVREGLAQAMIGHWKTERLLQLQPRTLRWCLRWMNPYGEATKAIRAHLKGR